MQYHLNGFHPGDPDIQTAAQAEASEIVDVLIVGCGPAGLTLAAQLAAFPAIKTRIVEQKSGPLERGQADGIACRSMEMFNAFGFVEQVMREAYWVNETRFWKPARDDPAKIERSGWVQDVEDGLSEFPHVILNQARVHDFYLEVMAKSPTRLVPDYSRQLVQLDLLDTEDIGPNNAAAVATFKRLDAGHEGKTEVIRARYVVGCDGARSVVRKAMGRELKGDSANKAWGVMDALLVTDFPDIRFKSLIQSETHGSIVIIPREGGYLTRIYVELDALAKGERVAARDLQATDIIAAANRVFHPYSIEVKEVAWWSVYEIGQRLTDKFDDVDDGDETRAPRVFIAGDACHTHSPKAGQGMNVSMRDSFNLGWKLAAVLQGQSPASLLHSYSAERQKVAKTLIDFDREWSRIISERPKSPQTSGADEAEFQAYFIKSGRYTAGTAIQYGPSIITGSGEHQGLARGFEIGTRFHSAPVVRLGDGKRVQLGHVVKADGRWRLLAFADKAGVSKDGPLADLCRFLREDAASPLRVFTPKDADIDAVFDLRAVLQGDLHGVELAELPDLLWPLKGRYGLRDYEKVFCVDHKDGPDIYELRGIDRDAGCLVIVRPDQHVAHVLPLSAHQALSAFFSGFMLAQNPGRP